MFPEQPYGLGEEIFEWADYFGCGKYSALDSLAAALFVNSPYPGGRLMAMFSANFDASGNAVDQPFVVVAGYIANHLQWRLFDESWKSVHDQFSVNLPFHMADFASALTNPNYKNQKNARQDYLAIAADEKKAQTFLARLTVTELTVANCSVTALIPMNVYNAVNSLLDLRKCRSALCARRSDVFGNGEAVGTDDAHTNAS